MIDFITVEDISFAYEDDFVLDHISLSVKSGEFVVIVGPNGAGKTTFLRLLAGLCPPTVGHIYIDGNSVKKAQKMGYIYLVPQRYNENAADFPATAAEIVGLGLVGSLKKMTSAERKNRVNEMLKLVDMSEYANRRIGEMSGGQQQRIMIAQALTGNPRLLLLDEPTSGIDVKASGRILDLLAQLNQALGITIVMISHDIDKSTKYASRVICINQHLCYDGKPAGFVKTHINSPQLWHHGG